MRRNATPAWSLLTAMKRKHAQRARRYTASRGRASGLVLKHARDVGGCRAQLGQEVLEHVSRRGAVHLAADVHRGNRTAVAVADWRRQRHQAFFEFLVDKAPALFAN